MRETSDLPAGLRILVVEDEMLIALDMEDVLRRLRCEVVGPAATIASALSAIAGADRLDGALLDLNVQGEAILPVIELLSERGVPYILATGYVRRHSDHPAVRDARRLAKPFGLKDVETAMRETFMQ